MRMRDVPSSRHVAPRLSDTRLTEPQWHLRTTHRCTHSRVLGSGLASFSISRKRISPERVVTGRPRREICVRDSNYANFWAQKTGFINSKKRVRATLIRFGACASNIMADAFRLLGISKRFLGSSVWFGTFIPVLPRNALLCCARS